MERVLINKVMLLMSLLILPSCNGVFFYPEKRHFLTPSDLDLQFEDIHLETSANNKIHAWYLPAKENARGTILHLHGNAENISTHIGGVYWLPQKAYNVFLLDYPGYGKSEGSASTPSALDSIEQSIKYLVERNDSLIVFGQSLGASLAIHAVANSAYRKHIKALILESPFASYRQIVREKISNIWLLWPFQWPLSLLVSDTFSPEKGIAQISPIPLLIVHSQVDKIVPIHHGLQLFKHAKEPKEFWKLDHAPHIQAFQEKEMRKKLISYIVESDL